MTPMCAFEIYAKSWQGPAEYCFNEAEPGSEYCTDHDPQFWEPDWDDRRKELLYDCE